MLPGTEKAIEKILHNGDSIEISPCVAEYFKDTDCKVTFRHKNLKQSFYICSDEQKLTCVNLIEYYYDLFREGITNE